MKRIFSLICLSLFFVCNSFCGGVYDEKTEMLVYTSDSGHKFYYFAPGIKNVTRDEARFVTAQDLYVSASILGPCDEDEVKQAAEEAFKEVIRVVYNQNKDYMWSHFPEHKYCFDEVCKIIRKLAWKTNIHHLDGSFECTIELCIGMRLQPGGVKKFDEQYPYIMGYIYKDVKRQGDGTPCKIQMPKF